MTLPLDESTVRAHHQKMAQTKVDPSELRQATLLAQPFHPSLVQRKPGNRGADYVSHPVVQQRFMFVTGAPTTTIVRELYSTVKGKPDLGSVLVSVLMRMELVIDGELHVAEEFGSCEHPENEMHDGERSKKAASDAYKRCAMRIAGVGLHLWCKNGYTLGDRMISQDRKEDAELMESNAAEEDQPEETLQPVTDVGAFVPKKVTDDMFKRLKALPNRKQHWDAFLAAFGALDRLPIDDEDDAWDWIVRTERAEESGSNFDPVTGEIASQGDAF